MWWENSFLSLLRCASLCSAVLRCAFTRFLHYIKGGKWGHETRVTFTKYLEIYKLYSISSVKREHMLDEIKSYHPRSLRKYFIVWVFEDVCNDQIIWVVSFTSQDMPSDMHVLGDSFIWFLNVSIRSWVWPTQLSFLYLISSGGLEYETAVAQTSNAIMKVTECLRLTLTLLNDENAIITSTHCFVNLPQKSFLRTIVEKAYSSFWQMFVGPSKQSAPTVVRASERQH